MKNVKNIIIGKIGKSVKFNSKNWNGHGGDNEAPTLFKLLAEKNPNINFYMLGKSDLRNLKPELKKELNIPNNIIDLWEGFDTKIHKDTDYPLQKLKELNIKMDCGIFYNGPASYASIPNFLKKKDGEFYSILDVFKKYVGPIVNVLNEFNIPYFTLGPDPRYIPIKAKDLINR